ncbi:hypothetical protein FJR37_22500, partial [Aphanizomenon sp. UHCC 0183]|nr:hypothetical protein [Aphanizomenon sp. UHCC 0183]
MNNPMNIVYDYQGIAIYLKKKINEGGEGEIWETSVDGQLAKIYLEKNRSTEMYAKIKFMIEHPPVNPTKHQGHNCFTWPTRLVRDDKQKFLGFLMPKIESAKELINLYSPQLRNSLLPEFNWKYLLTAAKNLAWIIYHIHERGYILGDIQPKNILVNNQALITIVDTDSF